MYLGFLEKKKVFQDLVIRFLEQTMGTDHIWRLKE